MAKKLLFVGLGLLALAFLALLPLTPATTAAALDITDTPRPPQNVLNARGGFNGWDSVYGTIISNASAWWDRPYTVSIDWYGGGSLTENPSFYGVFHDLWGETPITKLQIKREDGMPFWIAETNPDPATTGCGPADPFTGYSRGFSFELGVLEGYSTTPDITYGNSDAITQTVLFQNGDNGTEQWFEVAPSEHLELHSWGGKVSSFDSNNTPCSQLTWDLSWLTTYPTATPTATAFSTPQATPTTDPIAFFRVAWEQVDFYDGSRTTTFQTLLPPTTPYTVSLWNLWTNPYAAPNNSSPNNVGYFYDFTTNTAPSKLAVHNKNWNDAEDTGNRYYFYSEDIRNLSNAGGGSDCPIRPDPYRGLIWEVRLDDLSVGPIVTLQNTSGFTYYYKDSPILSMEKHVLSVGVWKGAAIVRPYPTSVSNPPNTTCGYVQWDLRDWMPSVPTATPTASPTVVMPSTATPLPPMATPTNTPVPQAPAAPSGLFATPWQGSLHLFWQDMASNEDGYRVYYSTNGSDWTTAAELLPNSGAFNLTGLACTTRYYVIVQAWNAVGSADASGQFMTGSGCPAPAPAPFQVYLPLVTKP